MAQGANAREAILDAAEAVVIESGAGHLTLAAVAAKAGVSKGGLLYHFPSKEDLLKGMLDRLIQRFDQARKEKAEGLKRKAGAQIKATILTYAEGDARKEKIGSALLAAGGPCSETPATCAGGFSKAFGRIHAVGSEFPAGRGSFLCLLRLGFLRSPIPVSLETARTASLSTRAPGSYKAINEPASGLWREGPISEIGRGAAWWSRNSGKG
jgi:AcrR family transcriptional regulator